jgi:DNA-directed RNA polymerase subunit H (RpoH/RPB5)
MQVNRNAGNFTPDGMPIAVPGDGSLGVPTMFAGTARDNRTSESMFRPDERLIVTEFNNLVIDTRANKIMRDNFVDDIEKMPRILFSDPVLVRMRAEGQNMSVNDIVEIERFSVTTGTELTWRVIVDE